MNIQDKTAQLQFKILNGEIKGSQKAAGFWLRKNGYVDCDRETCGRCNSHLRYGSREEIEKIQSEI